MINKKTLIAELERKAREAPVTEPLLLARYAMYQGLADRIRNGEFDYAVNENHDLVMDQEDDSGR